MLLPKLLWLWDITLPITIRLLINQRIFGRVCGMVWFIFQLLFVADSTNLHEKIFHYSQLTAACLVPVSFVLAPSAICVRWFCRFLMPRSLSITFCVCCILCTDASVWAMCTVITAALSLFCVSVTCRSLGRASRLQHCSSLFLECSAFCSSMLPLMVWLPLSRLCGDPRLRTRVSKCWSKYNIHFACLRKHTFNYTFFQSLSRKRNKWSRVSFSK